MSSNFIQFTINRNQGLSQAIDEALDKEFKNYVDDVNLNTNQWQSIFDIITSNKQAEQTQANQKQFTDKDNDITKYNQYQVNEGKYNITTETWELIVNKTKEFLHIGDTTNQSNPAASVGDGTAETVVSEDADNTANNLVEESVKTDVSNILTQAHISEDNVDLPDLYKKYKSIKTIYPNISNDKISKRIINYVRGMGYHNKENQFAKLYENNVETSSEKIQDERLSKAVEEKDKQAQIDAYHQMAKEFIEVYDNAKGNSKIQLYELMSREIKDKEKELGRKITKEERAQIQEAAIRYFTALNQNNDYFLDENEIAGYLWAMSNINNDKTYSDITYNEWKKSKECIVNFMLSKDANDEQKQDAVIFMQTVTNGYNGLKRD